MKKFTLLILVMLLGITGVKADVEWTIWEGSTSMGNWASWITLSPVNYADIEAGDILCLYATSESGGSANYYLQKIKSDWSWADFDCKNAISFTPTGTNANAQFEMTSAFVTELTASGINGLVIKGGYYTLTKVSIKKKSSMIKTVLSDVSKTTSTFAYTIPQSSLAKQVEGDYLYIAATQQSKEESESYKLEFKDATYWKYYTTLYNFQHDMWWSTKSDTIKNHDLYIYGEHYNTTGVYLYHPIPSFSIGSIGYATFSANQQVTAPNTVTAYKATINEGSVSLTPFTDNVIPANTGAIIKGDEGAVLEFVASSESTSEKSDLIACTSATNVSTLDSNYDYYVLYPGTGESETELSLSTLLGNFGGWNDKITWNSSTHTATYTEQTGNGEGGWVGKDWSAYDKLKLNFSANTLNDDVTFYVAYNGHDEATTQTTLSQGSTSSIEIELNSDYNNAIGNFSMFSNATEGSITFKSAALIDNDGATVAEFRKTTSGTLAANKAYLKIARSGSTPARALRVVFGDDITSINNVEAKKAVTINDDVIYNLNGQVVTNPSKGIYIKNGKKFIVK